MIEQQTTQKRDGHLVVYLVWPVAAGAALATVAGVSVTGVLALATGELVEAARIGGYVWFAVLATVTACVFWYAAREWAGPRQAARVEEIRQWIPEPYDVPEPPPPMVVRGFSRKLLPATVDHTVEAFGPVADPEIERLYKFIADCWRADDVSQAGCMSRQWRRADWDRYIGGSRRRADAGKESARGLLARAGIVAKDGNRWVICAPLDAALRMNDDLLMYASERAQVVRLDSQVKSSQDAVSPVSSVLTRGVGG